jgi:hypothetical protein
VALDYHAQRISDQHDLDTTFLDQAGETVIISSQAREFFTLLFQLLQVRDGDFVLEWFGDINDARTR